MADEISATGTKRKANAISKDSEEIEVDLNAPEPPSKKSLRKAKKAGILKKVGNGEVSKPTSSSSTEDALQTSNEATAGATPKEVPQKPRAEYGVWIGNLAFFTTKEDLTRFLTRPDTGVTTQDVTRVHLPKGPPKNGKPQNKGFAYIDFATRETQEAAIALSEQLLGGRRVLIKNAKSFEGRPEKAEAETGPSNPPSKKIFVGNLSFDITAEDLRNHFSQCGSIENIHLATFQDSGKCKGYAWVTFDDVSAAESAMRGWVEVDRENDEEDNRSVDGDSPSGVEKIQSRRQKIHVRSIHGRKIRMEFAEDSTTRYKKRFGKNTTDDDHAASIGAIAEIEQATGVNPAQAKRVQQNARVEADGSAAARYRLDRKSAPKSDDSRYEKATVQRLTGAAVKPQGTKVTFD